MNRSILTLVAGLSLTALALPKATAPARVDSQGGRATSARLRTPPAAAVATYTHFVTPNGSASSFCTEREPCSLPRAVSLIGTSNMRPGSTVLLQRGADGIYSQGPLAFDGNGRAEEPIKFIGQDGVRITGTQFEPPAAQWTRAPGRQFTYQLEWDDVAMFPVANVAQRPPVATWRPIRVDDRLPPFTRSLGRPFSLEFPIRYSPRSSIDLVEAQHCTFLNDRTNNRVYVHMCHDGPPADADNLHLGAAGWGSVVIDGDYLWLENLALEQIGGTALKVNPAANGTVLKRVAARAAQVWLEGTNTLAEDLEISHVITQGTHPTQCYDANPDFGVGECWNASGNGRALLVGRQERTTSQGQVVRRARIHRSWNGARVDGRHTLEESTFWGFPNHSLEVSGSGGVIRHNVFLNGQDSMYLEGEAFDDLTVEHNLFVNGALFWVSRDGSGGTPPKAWRFRYNILSSLVYDDKTYPTVTADCNAWIPSSANTIALLKVTGTDGAGDLSFATLDQIRTRTPLERNSIALPASSWTDGTVFRHYKGQSSAEFDFTPVNAGAFELCGQSVGPNTQGRAVPRGK
jgi:hypothetical protein